MYTAQEIEQLAARAAAQPFRPFAVYNSDSDSLDFFASNENFFAESVDSLVTVYYGQETNSVVGLRLKKVRKFFEQFLKNAPGFKTEIWNHRIKVEHLVTATIWASGGNPGDARVITFRKLRDVARSNDVEAEIDELAKLAV
jgi:hypothetical protein